MCVIAKRDIVIHSVYSALNFELITRRVRTDKELVVRQFSVQIRMAGTYAKPLPYKPRIRYTNNPKRQGTSHVVGALA